MRFLYDDNFVSQGIVSIFCALSLSLSLFDNYQWHMTNGRRMVEILGPLMSINHQHDFVDSVQVNICLRKHSVPIVVFKIIFILRVKNVMMEDYLHWM